MIIVLYRLKMKISKTFLKKYYKLSSKRKEKMLYWLQQSAFTKIT